MIIYNNRRHDYDGIERTADLNPDDAGLVQAFCPGVSTWMSSVNDNEGEFSLFTMLRTGIMLAECHSRHVW